MPDTIEPSQRLITLAVALQGTVHLEGGPRVILTCNALELDCGHVHLTGLPKT